MSLPLIAEISLKNLNYNLNAIKKLTNKTKFCAVIKSNAYGHGLVEIANALYNKVDAFAVSMESECVALRQAGIDKQIILLTPAFEENAERLILHKITFTVSNINEIEVLYIASKRVGMRANIHLALNTGMNRLGFSTLKSVNNAINYIKSKSEFLNLCGAFSHLGEPNNINYANIQREKFIKLSAPVKKYCKTATLHLSSSGGILLGSNFLFDMVRVGIMLYGYSPFKTDKIKLKPVMTVKARVVLNRYDIQNKYLMYGTNKCNENSASIIRFGYADGFRRVSTPSVIGNECMDLSAVNFTRNKYYTVMKNAEIIAKKYKTIAYEVLVNASKRAERIYK